MDDLFNPGRRAEIILLDYQCTFCENGHLRQQWLFNPANRNRSYSEWIKGEIMRNWLIPLFENRRVILITARKSCWQDVTLRRIREICGGWQPHEWYFNPDNSPPPPHKERILFHDIFPRYGSPDQTAYLALESNRQTRAMYARNGITAIRITDPLTELPFC